MELVSVRPHESIRIRHCDDDPLVAVVIRSIDQLRDATDRVLFRDYSAEGFASGRVATEFGCCCDPCGLASSGND